MFRSVWSAARVTRLSVWPTILSVALLVLSAQPVFAQSTVAGGGAFTLVVKNDGTLWAFGSNGDGQLGDNTTTARKSPYQIAGLSNIQAVAAAGGHVLALTTSGTVYSWGDNLRGQVGNGVFTTDRKTPYLLSLSNVVAIAAGDYHSLALTSSGDLYAWGENGYGELGNGTTTDAHTPAVVLTGVSAIGAGMYHSLAIKTDGTAWAFGRNNVGQLGNGTTSTVATTAPVQMLGVSGAVAIDGGQYHTIVRLSDGTLKAAGENAAGQLGDTTSTDRSTAVVVSGLSDVQRVSVGLNHAFAVKGDGSLWAWGDNANGKLGIGSIVDAHTATAVTALSNVQNVGTGTSHSIAVDATGIVSTWGLNSGYQLGDGTTMDRWTPVALSEAGYAWRVATPTFSPVTNTYSTNQNVTITSDTAGATIHFTLTGADPTETDPTYTAPVLIDRSLVLKARAWNGGMPASNVNSATYTMQVAQPSVSPTATTYTVSKTVTFSSATPGAAIRYTTDGSTPTESSTLYTGPFLVDHTTTFKIAGFMTGWTASTVRTSTYTMNFGTLSAPVIDPPDGTFTGSVTMTVSTNAPGVVHYTTALGTATPATPVATSPTATPITFKQSTKVRARSFHPDYTPSVGEVTRTYTVVAHTPMLSTASGSYAPGSTVTITAGEPTLDTLRMTIDGSDPTSTSPIVASGTSILLGDFTLKVKAIRANATDSAIASATYSLTAPLGPGAASAGGSHSLFATPDGRVIAWGENGNGQIGNESTVDRTTPTTLNTITGVTAVAGGLAHTLARTWDGQVFAWGSNVSGRLGDGTTTQRTRPTLITALSNIVALAAGDAHSLALTSDGHVYSWGENSDGQLGIGSTVDSLTPTQITTLSNIVAIAAGDTHSMAVTASGSLFVWGNNLNSRLGDGLTVDRTTPFLLSLNNVVAVAAGAAHSLAMTSSGAVYSWGLGTNGQLGRGNVSSATIPTLIPSLHASAIAAGDTFSAALRGDGVLVAWGLNSAGQLGDTTTLQATSPVIVSGPSSVSTLVLGDAHALAVTPDGNAWTWGAGASGQLGDGGISNRPAPQSVLAGIPSWIPSAPVINIPSGTYANMQSVAISSPIPGAVIRYTLTGQDPTDSDVEVTSGASLDISYSALFRARAFVDGRAGKIVRADYELQSVAPVIDPPTGTYTSAQTVSIAAPGPPSVIRYTTDGSDPTPTSTAYSQPFVVSTSQTLKARAFPTNGWPASGASTASLTFNYGQLSAPTSTPSEGVFPDPQTVALAASPGATIRFTTNGTDPTASSPIYTSPITVTSGAVTIKARAYHPDWTESPVSTQTYTIDVAPPTIVAKRFPLAMGNWQLTPVTVSFVCSDSVGVATCSSPSIVSLEGAGQTVSGTAVDHVGREATVQETVNVDLTPPVVTLTAPADGLVTASSTVAVSAEVVDALSGLGVVNCNGVATAVVDGIVTCTATLRPGRNSITVSARDVAGHSSSAGATVTLAGTPTLLTLSPANRTMLVDESATLSLRDDFGVPAPAATWVSSNPSVVSLSPDDPPVLTALSAGTATITATKNGLSGVSTITVVAGASLPEGTTQWTVAPTFGGGSSWFEAPIYTNRIDETGPDLFMVETNTTTWERRLRGMSASGEVAFLAASPGVPLMGDMLGGVIAGVEPSGNYCVGPFNEIQRCYTALARFAGPTGTTSWRYDSPGMVDRPAQGPDGTIYVVEHLGNYLYQPNNNGNAYFPYPGEKALVILDGATGEVTARVPLEGDPDREPVTVGPIVGSDGFGYILVTKGSRLTLHTMAREGQVAEEVITQGCAGCSTLPHQLMPDGVGGLLIVAYWNTSSQGPFEHRLTRLDGAGERTDRTIGGGTIEMIGQGGAAHVRVTSGVPTVSQPVMDISTWTPRWYLPVEWRLLASTADGGAVAQNAAGDIAHFDGTGQLLRTIPATGLRNPIQYLGGLVGNSDYGLRAAAGTFDDSTYWDATYKKVLWSGEEQYGFGTRTRQNAPPPSFATREEAALRALDFIYRLSAAANVEYGGLICRQNDRFVWSRFVTDFNQSQVNVPDSLCPTGSLAAHLHTHPPIEPGSAPTDPGDYNNADAHPQIPYYLRTPALDLPMPATATTKYWNSGARTAKENLCLRSGTTWIPYTANSGAICATPQP